MAEAVIAIGGYIARLEHRDAHIDMCIWIQLSATDIAVSTGSSNT